MNPTEGFIQTYTISVFDGYSCPGVYSVIAGLWIGEIDILPPTGDDVFILPQGVSTRSFIWPQVTDYAFKATIVSYVCGPTYYRCLTVEAIPGIYTNSESKYLL